MALTLETSQEFPHCHGMLRFYNYYYETVLELTGRMGRVSPLHTVIPVSHPRGNGINPPTEGIQVVSSHFHKLVSTIHLFSQSFVQHLATLISKRNQICNFQFTYLLFHELWKHWKIRHGSTWITPGSIG